MPNELSEYAPYIALFGYIAYKEIQQRKKPKYSQKPFAIVENSREGKNIFVRRVNLNGGSDTMEFRMPGLTAREVPEILPAKVIKKFFLCATPSRKEWVGAAEQYSKAVKIASHYGWIEQNGKGYIWRFPFNRQDRRIRWIDAAD